MTQLEINQLNAFKDFWNRHYGYITLELTDDKILGYLKWSLNFEGAADRISDYLLSNGLGNPQE